MRLTFLWASLVFIVFMGGCASEGPSVLITPLNAEKTGVLSQEFDEAYAVVRQTGEMDIVLTESPTADRLQQIMHLRILWKPMRGTKSDQPSTTNAVIDWSIFDPANGSGGDQLRYSGAGFVVAYRSGETLDVRIRNASVRLAARRGAIADPVGPATLQGRFDAKIDPARVEAALATLRGDAATSSSASLDGR
jgi:hypothetical protein